MVLGVGSSTGRSGCCGEGTVLKTRRAADELTVLGRVGHLLEPAEASEVVERHLDHGAVLEVSLDVPVSRDDDARTAVPCIKDRGECRTGTGSAGA